MINDEPQFHERENNDLLFSLMSLEDPVESPLDKSFSSLCISLSEQKRQFQKYARVIKKFESSGKAVKRTPLGNGRSLIDINDNYLAAQFSIELAKHGLNGISTAIIITLARLINSIARDLQARSNKSPGTFLGLQPHVNFTPWGSALIAASNYVRHNQDWRAKYEKLGIDIDSPDAIDAFARAPKTRSDTINNLRTLERLGFAPHLLLGAKISEYELAAALRLQSIREISKNTRAWVKNSRQLFEEYLGYKIRKVRLQPVKRD